MSRKDEKCVNDLVKTIKGKRPFVRPIINCNMSLKRKSIGR
jgi:hypothetical protein